MRRRGPQTVAGVGGTAAPGPAGSARCCPGCCPAQRAPQAWARGLGLGPGLLLAPTLRQWLRPSAAPPHAPAAPLTACHACARSRRTARWVVRGPLQTCQAACSSVPAALQRRRCTAERAEFSLTPSQLPQQIAAPCTQQPLTWLHSSMSRSSGCRRQLDVSVTPHQAHLRPSQSVRRTRFLALPLASPGEAGSQSSAGSGSGCGGRGRCTTCCAAGAGGSGMGGSGGGATASAASATCGSCCGGGGGGGCCHCACCATSCCRCDVCCSMAVRRLDRAAPRGATQLQTGMSSRCCRLQGAWMQEVGWSCSVPFSYGAACCAAQTATSCWQVQPA